MFILKDKETIIEALIHYYDAAGLKDSYEKKLKNMTDEELYELYDELYISKEEEK